MKSNLPSVWFLSNIRRERVLIEMEFRNISIELKNKNILQIPADQKPRQITIDPSKFSIELDQLKNSDVILCCYKIHLIHENQDIFVYLFKNIHPTSYYYDLHIRDGDRLMNINNEETFRISSEKISSLINEEQSPLICQIIWHPELYIEFSKLNSMMKRIDSNVFSPRIGIDLNVYTQTVRYLLDYQPNEPMKFIGHLSNKDENPTNDWYSFAQHQLSIFSNPLIIEGNTVESLNNLVELNTLFEQISIGLNREETYWIWLAMKNFLVEKDNIQKLRFWGKIFGLKNDYYILEADLDSFDNLDQDDSEFLKSQETSSDDEDNISSEPISENLNQKIFYVSTRMDQPFVQLPLVTLEQIESSRRIQRFFTGDLEASVLVGWMFPGVEKHLLRAQIQRISAGTQISPKNYFRIVTNEEGELEEELSDHKREDNIELTNQTTININSEFEGNTLQNLAQPNGEYWVHYVPYLSQQSRNETGKVLPPLLSPINEDTNVQEFYPAWSAGMSSRLIPEHSLIYVRSNRWPGAYTVGDRHRFKSIYIGWGIKIFSENQSTNLLHIFPENESNFSIIEIDDPTVDEENELFQSSILLSPDDDEEFEETIE